MRGADMLDLQRLMPLGATGGWLAPPYQMSPLYVIGDIHGELGCWNGFRPNRMPISRGRQVASAAFWSSWRPIIGDRGRNIARRADALV